MALVNQIDVTYHTVEDDKDEEDLVFTTVMLDGTKLGSTESGKNRKWPDGGHDGAHVPLERTIDESETNRLVVITTKSNDGNKWQFQADVDAARIGAPPKRIYEDRPKRPHHLGGGEIEAKMYCH